jgi:hypothetical protein
LHALSNTRNEYIVVLRCLHVLADCATEQALARAKSLAAILIKQ